MAEGDGIGKDSACGQWHIHPLLLDLILIFKAHANPFEYHLEDFRVNQVLLRMQDVCKDLVAIEARPIGVFGCRKLLLVLINIST